MNEEKQAKRQQKLMKVAAKKEQQQAKLLAKEAARFRRHGPKATVSFAGNFIPALAGISMMMVILVLLNGQWITAQYQYRFNKPVSAASSTGASVAASTSVNSAVTADTKSPHPELGPRLYVPAINVEAPVAFDKGTAEWQIQVALRSGVVHFDNSVKPGQPGNVVIFGHSSGQLWAPGDYKFIFTLLNKVQPSDVVYVDYDGTRYTYKVTDTQVVPPSDTSVLASDASHKLTLITCTPVGTSKDRLIVHAEQISPSPVKADATASNIVSKALKQLPGSAR